MSNRVLAGRTVQDVIDRCADARAVEDSRPMATKYLSKYRPGFVEAAEAKAESSALAKSGAAITA